ncbi:hypothetical protein MSS4_00956 [Mycobacterium marinum]|nr:hypothetical protein MSS4_00956 [Mycobacterium marinum]
MGYGPGAAATKLYPLDTPAPLRGTDATAGLRITMRRAARLSVNYRVSTALGAPPWSPTKPFSNQFQFAFAISRE